MTWPIARIVDAPDLDARVLVELNQSPSSGDGWLEWDDITELLGDPEFSTTTDGEIVEGTRQITLPLRYDGPRHKAMESKAQLARVLSHPNPGFFMFQVGPKDPPTYFRLHQRISGALDLKWVSMLETSEDFWEWNVTVEADAFGLSQKVTTVAKVSTVEKGAGKSPVVDLGEIKGSMPAPATLDFKPSSRVDGWVSFVHACAVDKGSPLSAASPLVMYGGDFTAQGSGSKVDRYSDDMPEAALKFNANANAGTAGAKGIVGYVTFPNGKVPPGSYRVVLLVGRDKELTGANGSPQFRVGSRWGSLTSWARAAVPFPTTDESQECAFLDCGLLTFPNGTNPNGLTASQISPPQISIGYKGVANQPNDRTMAVSRVYLIPVSVSEGAVPASALKASWYLNAGPDGNNKGRLDSDRRVVNCLNIFDQVTPAPAPLVMGGFPTVVPGERNLVTYLPRVRTTAIDWWNGHQKTLSHTAEITVSYYPRWLHLAAT